jgi:membrane protease YdiL (CAAX protease family)
MKGIFANRSAWFQLGILTYSFLFGLILGSTITFVINNLFNIATDPATGGICNQSFYNIHATQLISDIFIFLLPAICTAFLCSYTPGKFLHIQKISDSRIFILAALMVLLISPAIDITSYLNTKIHLPDFLSPLEKRMQETEDNLTQVTESLLSEKGVIPFTVNIFIIAVMAGLTEELLFRGALLSIIRKRATNPHVAIWIVAIIFSAIHFQFYGFIPRVLLGTFLGYLLFWSKSIWVPVFAHFLNNAIAVTGSYTGFFPDSKNDITSETTEIKTEEMITAIAIALAGLILFALCAKIMRKINSG